MWTCVSRCGLMRCSGCWRAAVSPSVRSHVPAELERLSWGLAADTQHSDSGLKAPDTREEHGLLHTHRTKGYFLQTHTLWQTLLLHTSKTRGRQATGNGGTQHGASILIRKTKICHTQTHNKCQVFLFLFLCTYFKFFSSTTPRSQRKTRNRIFQHHVSFLD